MYAAISKILSSFFKQSTIFKYGFNVSPMYRRSTGKIIEVSEDLFNVKVKIPISYKNKNYVGSVFGGSLFSATDPIFMIQLMNILGDDYVVWDKAAVIKYKRPARENAFAKFLFSKEEINQIKNNILVQKEIDIKKQVNIVNQSGIVFAEVTKTIYISQKSYYKEKVKSRKSNS